MKPVFPQLRRFKDKVLDLALSEIRTFLRGVEAQDVLWGEYIEVEFDGANPVAINHGLDHVPRGYVVVRKSANFDVYDAAPVDDGRLHLTASAAGFARIYVF